MGSRPSALRTFAATRNIRRPMVFWNRYMKEGIMSSQTSQRPNAHTPDETAVGALYQELMHAWNEGSSEAYAAAFAEDGDLIGFDGTHFKGRQEIAPFHQRLFETYLKGTRLVGEVTSVRFLSPDVAVMHALGGTVMRGKSQPAPERDSIQTLIAIKRGGQWRLAAFQNMSVRPMGRNVRGTIIWLFSDWLWKVFGPKK